MTFDDDMLQLEFDGGTRNITCKKAGVEWPPPDQLYIYGFNMRLKQLSSLTDEQRAGMTNILRGARYVPSNQSKEDKS